MYLNQWYNRSRLTFENLNFWISCGVLRERFSVHVKGVEVCQSTGREFETRLHTPLRGFITHGFSPPRFFVLTRKEEDTDTFLWLTCFTLLFRVDPVTLDPGSYSLKLYEYPSLFTCDDSHNVIRCLFFLTMTDLSEDLSRSDLWSS